MVKLFSLLLVVAWILTGASVLRGSELARKARAYLEGGNLKGALEVLEMGLAAGDAESMIQLGTLYLEGQGVPVSETRARELYRQAADQGDPSGLEQLASKYVTAGLLPEAEEIFNQLTELQVDPCRLMELANGYLELGGDYYQKGRELIETAATLGCEVATTWVIEDHLSEGRFAEAEQLLVERAKGGQPDGLNRFAHDLQGQGKLDQAERLYWICAEAGDFSGIHRLASEYAWGGPGTAERAEQLFRKLHEKGDCMATMSLVGRMRERGEGLEELERVVRSDSADCSYFRGRNLAWLADGISGWARGYDASPPELLELLKAEMLFRESAKMGIMDGARGLQHHAHWFEPREPHHVQLPFPADPSKVEALRREGSCYEEAIIARGPVQNLGLDQDLRGQLPPLGVDCSGR